ncbi:MAG TPA: enoyl-CoA hydratase/isomerase family protein [Geminicoccaceae bacterium]|nr:enoyl-CoA hydratase/isomerase family protein [Geminicoccaceae bacterium]
MRASDEIRIERRGGLVIVTLNRPRALNALSFDMCRAIHEGLASWQADPDVHAVLIKGAGERAFCSGGDIRWLYDVLLSQGEEPALAFYALEYPMNARLHHFTKPYVALLDGITMGGGVGVSVHGSHRVVTERTMFAMPETGIGLFPDVGATYVLPRLPGALGLYLGLTGARLGAADCVWTGIGSCYVPSERLDEVEARLAETDLASDAHRGVQHVLDDLRADPGPPPLVEQMGRIDACYGRKDLGAVLYALGAEETGWGQTQLEQLSTKSPTSLAVTSRQLQEGAALSFDGAMRLEYRLVPRFLAGHDFREGIRALIVDKDGQPAWRPSRLEDVSAADVDAYFRPLPGGDLRLDGPASAG